MYSKGNLIQFLYCRSKFDGDRLINNYLENGLTNLIILMLIKNIKLKFLLITKYSYERSN